MKWAEGWGSIIPCPASVQIEEGMVFTTRGHGHGEDLFSWIVSKYQPDAHQRLGRGDKPLPENGRQTHPPLKPARRSLRRELFALSGGVPWIRQNHGGRDCTPSACSTLLTLSTVIERFPHGSYQPAIFPKRLEDPSPRLSIPQHFPVSKEFSPLLPAADLQL